MNFQTEKLGGHMAAAVSGVDLNRLPDVATQQALIDVLHDNLVLCIRDQNLKPPAFLDAMSRFGTPMLRKQLARTPECAEVNIISSEDRDVLGDGKKIVNGANWHTDDSFMREPCSLTMLYGVEVPSRGGDTQFTNMYAAYSDLPAETRARIDPLKVIHKYSSSRKLSRISTRPAEEMAAMPEATHPLVRTHPETRRKSLYLNPNRMEQIVGLDRAESDQLLDELIAHATQPKYQYRHVWRQGDIVIWDNRCTMHKANADYPEGERRLMHRVIVAGTEPF
ncbi:TauD/TfdA family dioxygenase [Reyranella sp.]|uniref:TauD/TfdA dioxygenase family protein n=1 Tax=Reyranella sp. TaxID=1929291 RepID=UPI001222EE01|nr:TauD/TfdA family dioxygenase [Reyranella sp.]TAJ87457.1 MAG: TauD/TfdA family dioxygenase [Reyranella sp.]